MLEPRVLTAAAVLLAASLWCGDAAQASTSSPSDKQVAGEVVVAGGSDEDNRLTNVDVFDGPLLPWLPEGVEGNTLTAVGSVLYSCGGYTPSSFSANCYILDTSQENLQWTLGFALPIAMAHHTSVTVGDDIWFTYQNIIYVYDSSLMSFVEYATPFSVILGHCAVSNASHSFVIGVGVDSNEIWMNSAEFSPVTWERVYDMSTQCLDCRCLWSGNEIFITGGHGTENITKIFDISSDTMQSVGSLVQGRFGHGMYHFDGKPAVVGGYGGIYLDSVETYDADTQKWSLDDRTLGQGRYYFGLAQLQTS